MPVSDKAWANIVSELEKDHLRGKLQGYRMFAAVAVVLIIGLGSWLLVLQSSNPLDQAFMRAQALPARVQLPVYQPTDGRGALKMLATNAEGALQRSHPSKAGGIAGNHAPEPRSTAQSVTNAQDWRADAWQKILYTLQARVPALLPRIALREIRPSETAGTVALREPTKSSPSPRNREKVYTFAEDKGTDGPPARHRWEMTAAFSPDMTYASTEPFGQLARVSSVRALDPAVGSNRFSPVVAYGATVRTAFALNERWSLRTGLALTRLHSTGTLVEGKTGKMPVSYQNNLRLHSLELPIAVKYNLVHRSSLDCYLSTGVSGSFLLSYDNYLQSPEGSIALRRGSDASDVMRPSQASLLLSTGLRCQVWRRLGIQLEPGIRYGIVTSQYTVSRTHPVSSTFVSGLSYQL
jgi:hypothetical protein